MELIGSMRELQRLGDLTILRNMSTAKGIHVTTPVKAEQSTD